jgi:hypothetical protein
LLGLRDSFPLSLDLFDVTGGEGEERSKGWPTVANNLCKGLEEAIVWLLTRVLRLQKLLLKNNDAT